MRMLALPWNLGEVQTCTSPFMTAARAERGPKAHRLRGLESRFVSDLAGGAVSAPSFVYLREP